MIKITNCWKICENWQKIVEAILSSKSGINWSRIVVKNVQIWTKIVQKLEKSCWKLDKKLIEIYLKIAKNQNQNMEKSFNIGHKNGLKIHKIVQKARKNVGDTWKFSCL